MQATYDVHTYGRREMLLCRSSKPAVGLLPCSGSTEQAEKAWWWREGQPELGILHYQATHAPNTM